MIPLILLCSEEITQWPQRYVSVVHDKHTCGQHNYI